MWFTRFGHRRKANCPTRRKAVTARFDRREGTQRIYHRQEFLRRQQLAEDGTIPPEDAQGEESEEGGEDSCDVAGRKSFIEGAYHLKLDKRTAAWAMSETVAVDWAATEVLLPGSTRPAASDKIDKNRSVLTLVMERDCPLPEGACSDVAGHVVQSQLNALSRGSNNRIIHRPPQAFDFLLGRYMANSLEVVTKYPMIGTIYENVTNHDFHLHCLYYWC